MSCASEIIIVRDIHHTGAQINLGATAGATNAKRDMLRLLDEGK